MLGKIYKIYKREGLVNFFLLVFSKLQIKNRLIQLFYFPIAFPVALIILAISPWIPIRLIRLASNRVGHYPIDIEVMLCVCDTNLVYPKKTKIFFYNVAGHPICNQQIYIMLKRIIPIIPFPRLATEIDRYLQGLNSAVYQNDPVKKYFAKDCRDRWNYFAKLQKSHMNFTTAEENKGKLLLQEMGIAPDAKFVCLLARDSLYLDKLYPKNNWSYHDYRDVKIENYKKAALYLAEKGYYVLRMGKHVRERFNVDHPRIIDYANSHFRSDFLDVYLSAKCFFYISTSTGIDAIAKIFRRPLVITDAPLPDLDIWLHRDIFIPKKVMDMKTREFLTFSKIYQEFHDTSLKKMVVTTAREKNLQFIDNSPDEIKDVVAEMEARLTGNWIEDVNHEQAQKNFWQGFHQDFSGGIPVLKNQEYRGENIHHKMKVGTAFLKNNITLLANPEPTRAGILTTENEI